ncbi:hypothetical protein [Streptomyces fuscichromogenes]|uniref:Uncharacterized protein n=1 Tax=Streptomyces fuscichromogenes TaxID=1324013 RepID=A0A918CTM1_9ACTN|nr:hypothetical protein [Streptomyces fuscichromogenes]GGN23370.1 hypothetical protein GCM10011578_055620 [Streptomyces fuscichromogenes]
MGRTGDAGRKTLDAACSLILTLELSDRTEARRVVTGRDRHPRRRDRGDVTVAV